jgi:hypothetical protein
MAAGRKKAATMIDRCVSLNGEKSPLPPSLPPPLPRIKLMSLPAQPATMKSGGIGKSVHFY